MKNIVVKVMAKELKNDGYYKQKVTGEPPLFLSPAPLRHPACLPFFPSPLFLPP